MSLNFHGSLGTPGFRDNDDKDIFTVSGTLELILLHEYLKINIKNSFSVIINPKPIMKSL